jgi:hypothetical protein
MTKQCYEFKKYNYKEGLLDKSVDATYILHLKNNGRYKDIVNQLEKYKPTKTVYILFNEGFKKCNKPKNINKSYIDLTYTNYQIFKHAEKENYKNILILEDDFIFSENIKEKSTIDDLNIFLNLNKNNNIIYYLGSFPHLQLSLYTKHNILLISTGTHANIYTWKNRVNIMKKFNNDIDTDIDYYLNKDYVGKRYTYYKPLCYQLFPETENSNNWWNPLGLTSLFKKYLKFLNLDKQTEPGYKYSYFISKILFYLILIFIIYIIYLLINKYKLFKNHKSIHNKN